MAKRTITASITSQGQVTIPVDVRKTLNLTKPGKIEFVIVDDEVRIKRPMFTLEEVFGSVPAIPNVSADFDQEIDEAVAAHIDEKYGRRERP
ncbi:MAG: AbrB/MazE/SpoVT family DNA-binding domain-containing protein [Thermomicrobiales bacterium]